jgi:hypothetical protein
MCWYCGSAITDPEPIGRSLRCVECGKDLRVCKHCKFFLPGSRSDCKEADVQMQPDKERANFCDWFSLDPKFRTASSSKEREAAQSSKAAFENLFK